MNTASDQTYGGETSTDGDETSRWRNVEVAERLWTWNTSAAAAVAFVWAAAKALLWEPGYSYC